MYTYTTQCTLYMRFVQRRKYTGATGDFALMTAQIAPKNAQNLMFWGNQLIQNRPNTIPSKTLIISGPRSNEKQCKMSPIAVLLTLTTKPQNVRIAVVLVKNLIMVLGRRSASGESCYAMVVENFTIIADLQMRTCGPA
jgi:hypothetical protein